jgi:LPXTG-site transpeptidase (sortase) family protein
MALRLSQLLSSKRSLLLGVFALAIAAAVILYAPPANNSQQIQNTNQTTQAHAMDRALPTRLVIEKIGISAPIIELGLDDKGALEVPSRGTDAGWYVKSPTPGEIGPSVIAGHYDWENGPALFYRLKDLKVGDEIKVEREDGTTAKFIVERTAQYDQDKFPTIEVYGPTTKPLLRLITCAGSYDQKADRYSDNYVVYARLVQ